MKKIILFTLPLWLLIVSCGKGKSNTTKYPTGELQSEFKTDGEGKKEGVYKEYYPSGALKMEVDYDHGVINGTKKEYYENGHLKEYGTYDHDTIVGCKILFYDNGVPAEVITMRDQKENVIVGYHNNGYISSFKMEEPDFLLNEKGKFMGPMYIKFNEAQHPVPEKTVIPFATTSADTVKLGSEFVMNVGILYSYLGSEFYVETADYDETFKVKDDHTIKLWPPSGSTITISEKASSKGMHIFRFIIYSFKRKGDVMESHPIPLQRIYYVE